MSISVSTLVQTFMIAMHRANLGAHKFPKPEIDYCTGSTAEDDRCISSLYKNYLLNTHLK